MIARESFRKSAEWFDSRKEANRIYIAPSPHLHSGSSTREIMGDVLIALLPALIGACYFFGLRCAVLIAFSIVSALLASVLWAWGRKRKPVFDLSEVVTAVLLAMTLPPAVPIYLPVIGSAFAIIIVKECYGGLGYNFLNPALAARVLLVICFSAQMTAYSPPAMAFSSAEMATIQKTEGVEAVSSATQEEKIAETDMSSSTTTKADKIEPKTDAVSSATPLNALKEKGFLSDEALMDGFLGAKPGALGETSALLLTLGFVYLLVRRVIHFRIPLSIWLGMIVMCVLFGGERVADIDYSFVLGHVVSGGTMLGAIFMATDYATTPQSPKAQWVYGAAIGALTMAFRLWGRYAEGMSYAILTMNLAAPLLDRVMRPRVFGEGGKSYAKQKNGRG